MKFSRAGNFCVFLHVKQKFRENLTHAKIQHTSGSICHGLYMGDHVFMVNMFELIDQTALHFKEDHKRLPYGIPMY